MTNIQRTEVGGLVDAQTEARAIAWRGEYKQPGTDRWIVRYVDDDKPTGNNWRNVSPLFDATALAAKDAELAEAVREIERLKNLVGDPQGTADHAEAFLARAERAEAALAEARKVLEPFARLELPTKPQGNAGAYSIFHDSIRAARRALTGGQEDG